MFAAQGFFIGKQVKRRLTKNKNKKMVQPNALEVTCLSMSNTKINVDTDKNCQSGPSKTKT